MSDFNQGGGTYSKLLEAQEKKHQPAATDPVLEPAKQETKAVTEQKPKKSVSSDVMTSSNHESSTSRHHEDSTPDDDDFIEYIRKSVKQVGTKNSSHRLTQDEKDAITDIIYALKKKGLNTNENEMARIAINYLAADFRQNKQSSLLVRVLERLNS
jgi:hypothetical protein